MDSDLTDADLRDALLRERDTVKRLRSNIYSALGELGKPGALDAATAQRVVVILQAALMLSPRETGWDAEGGRPVNFDPLDQWRDE